MSGDPPALGKVGVMSGTASRRYSPGLKEQTVRDRTAGPRDAKKGPPWARQGEVHASKRARTTSREDPRNG